MLIFSFIDKIGAANVGSYDNLSGQAVRLDIGSSLYECALKADRENLSLERMLAAAAVGAEHVDIGAIAAEGRFLPPVSHPDPAHMLLTGTGLTHRASAESRDRMHAAENAGAETDTIRMYRLGETGGRRSDGQPGAAPEWFYKGDGSMLVSPGAPLTIPDFAEDGGEETEIAGVYLIGHSGTPRRIGYALANEFSDHVVEKTNYLYLAHSKLRQSSIGPMILMGDLPNDVRGTTTIRRAGEIIWQSDFASGEANMCHSIANLEYHHFKYSLFRKPGDIHIHYFGAATVSFGDNIRIEPGDSIAIASDVFGLPLINMVRASGSPAPVISKL